MADINIDCVSSNMVGAESEKNVTIDDEIEIEKPHQENGKELSFGHGGSEPLIVFPFPNDDDFLVMVERETEHLPKDDYLMRLRSEDLEFTVRKDAVDWISKVHAYFGFGDKCFVLSINYFDRFLSVHEFPRGKNWTMQLLAVACLSLAAKMEEVEVPPIVDLQVGDPKFVFEAETIQRMELLVLSILNWRMKPYTPCTFIDYFLEKIIDNDRFPLKSLMPEAMKVIIRTIKGIDFLEFKASEIAAAVALYVSGEIETMDIVKAMSSLKHVQKGKVLKCLEMIDDLTMTSMSSTTTTTNETSASTSSSTPQSPNGVLEATCMSYKTDEGTTTTIDSHSNSSINNTSTDSKRRKLE